MSQTPLRPLPRLLAVISSLAVAGVAAVALWHYLGGSGGDDPATRRAVIDPVQEAVDAAAGHSETCTRRFADLPRTDRDDAELDAQMAKVEECGATARRLAEQGYAALDTATGPEDSPLRAKFLDSAGALLSVYELQGDDFDVIYDLLHATRASGAPLAPVDSDVSYLLGNASSDIAEAREEFERTRDAYRAGG